MSSLLLKPRWIVAHVIIVTVAIAFVSLGLWQLDRLAEVKAENATIAARLDGSPRPLGDVLADMGEDAEYAPVEVTGRFVPDEEVLQRSRDRNGVNGFHVLTPLETGRGEAVLVRRGWVPFELDTPPVAEAAPPAGEVTVTGYLERSEPQPEGFGQRDPDDGVLERVFRADTARIDRQTSADLVQGYVVHLEEQTPGQPGALPHPPDRPELDEANHLSYALQWFSFAAIALIGYPVVLRKRIGERRDEDAAALADEDREGVSPSA